MIFRPFVSLELALSYLSFSGWRLYRFGVKTQAPIGRGKGDFSCFSRNQSDNQGTEFKTNSNHEIVKGK